MAPTPPRRPPHAPPARYLAARPPRLRRSAGHPFLKLPGSNAFRTIPDGLWLHFGADPDDPWVDILCIEACSTVPNLQDKRARFAPSTSSMLVVCPHRWLLQPVEPEEALPRWRLIRLLREEPQDTVMIPVRDIRVIYGLKANHYQAVAAAQVPQPHEYFCPMDALTAERGHEDPAMAALISRASHAANFMHMA